MKQFTRNLIHLEVKTLSFTVAYNLIFLRQQARFEVHNVGEVQGLRYTMWVSVKGQGKKFDGDRQ